MKQSSGNVSDEERDYDALPVEDFKSEITASILANQVVVVIGETGSGKTTKIPQYVLNWACHIQSLKMMKRMRRGNRERMLVDQNYGRLR